MFPVDFGVAELEKLLLVFGRVGAILLYIPLMERNQIPVRVKVLLALVLSFFISPLVGNITPSASRGLIEIIILFSTEVIIGLIIAFAAHLVFSAFQVAGSIIDVQMGYGLANVIDPQNGPKAPVVSRLYLFLAILIYFAISAHHLTVFAIVESFQVINPQTFAISEALMLSLVDLFAGIFITAIKIAGPIMAVLFVASLGMGLIGRAIPQMNVLIISFPLQIGVGLLMTALALTIFNASVINHISSLPNWMSSFLQ